MEEFLLRASEFAIQLVDILALAIILYATIEAFLRAVWLIPHPSVQTRREVWLRYAHWLVAGLTFQLGADIIETATAPSWTDIGKLGAVAAIRTFLNFFLERDLSETTGAEEAEGARETGESGLDLKR